MEEKQKIGEKEFAKKVARLMGKVDMFEEYLDSVEILDREIKTFAGGTSSHIILPKRHAGKNAKILIKPLKEMEEAKKE